MDIQNLIDYLIINSPGSLVEGKETVRLNYEFNLLLDLPDDFDRIKLESCLIDCESFKLLDMRGIDIVSDYVAAMLIEFVSKIASEDSKPIVFINVSYFVLSTLRNQAKIEKKNAWAFDYENKMNLLGHLPPSQIKVLGVLLDNVAGANSQEIAESLNIETGKTRNNISPYLHKMHKMGLLLRESQDGSDRNKIVRGWTYRYSIPSLDAEEIKPYLLTDQRMIDTIFSPWG